MLYNHLFFVCPDARLEFLLKDRYGEGSYFLNSLAGVFDFECTETLEVISRLVSQRRISKLFFVNDISCRFIDSVVNDRHGYGTRAEATLAELMIAHFDSILWEREERLRKQKLAELNVLSQGNLLKRKLELHCPDVVSTLAIGGLISDKSRATLTEVLINKPLRHESGLSSR